MSSSLESREVRKALGLGCANAGRSGCTHGLDTLDTLDVELEAIQHRMLFVVRS